MKRITVDYVMSLNPCYDRAWVEDKFDGRKWMSPPSVLKLDISIDDKLWLLFREDFLTYDQLVRYATACADHVKHRGNRNAAGNAACWSGAAAYARLAAGAAAWDARLAAEYARYASAAGEYASGAEWYVAVDDEVQWQTELLGKILREEE